MNISKISCIVTDNKFASHKQEGFQLDVYDRRGMKRGFSGYFVPRAADSQLPIIVTGMTPYEVYQKLTNEPEAKPFVKDLLELADMAVSDIPIRKVE